MLVLTWAISLSSEIIESILVLGSTTTNGSTQKLQTMLTLINLESIRRLFAEWNSYRISHKFLCNGNVVEETW